MQRPWSHQRRRAHSCSLWPLGFTHAANNKVHGYFIRICRAAFGNSALMVAVGLFPSHELSALDSGKHPCQLLLQTPSNLARAGNLNGHYRPT